jgi:putative oxidoreductase
MSNWYIEAVQWAACMLRIQLGIVFILHGSQKVFGILGGPGMPGFIQWSSTLGLPAALAYAAAYAELIGGLLLFFGILAELGALMVIPVMLGAIFLVHWKNGFFIQNSGYEYCLLLIVVAVAIMLLGPGKLALYNPRHW